MPLEILAADTAFCTCAVTSRSCVRRSVFTTSVCIWPDIENVAMFRFATLRRILTPLDNPLECGSHAPAFLAAQTCQAQQEIAGNFSKEIAEDPKQGKARREDERKRPFEAQGKPPAKSARVNKVCFGNTKEIQRGNDARVFCRCTASAIRLNRWPPSARETAAGKVPSLGVLCGDSGAIPGVARARQSRRASGPARGPLFAATARDETQFPSWFFQPYRPTSSPAS